MLLEANISEHVINRILNRIPKSTKIYDFIKSRLLNLIKRNFDKKNDYIIKVFSGKKLDFFVVIRNNTIVTFFSRDIGKKPPLRQNDTLLDYNDIF